jgi:acyl-homoserine lactone acylase PvdQ
MSRPHSVGALLTPDTVTTLFVVPTRMIAKWNLLYAYNGTASAKDFRAWWYDKSEDLEIPVVYDYPLDATSFLKFDGGSYVVLDEGDEIRVWIEDDAANAGVIVTMELEQRSTVQNFL